MIYPGPTLYPGAPNAYPSYSEPVTKPPRRRLFAVDRRLLTGLPFRSSIDLTE